MPVDPDAEIEITAFDWVPDFARGQVRDLRPRWACEELGLPYRERLVSAVERPRWLYAEQPWGQVPVLRAGNVRMFESGAILLHLAERQGELLPQSGQQRANALSWLFAAFNSVEPLLMELAEVLIFASGEDWAEARRPGLLIAIGERLTPVEQALSDRDWLAADFSIADIAMISMLRMPGLSQILTAHPALLAYRDRGEQRPTFRRALDAQLAAFSNEPSNKGE